MCLLVWVCFYFRKSHKLRRESPIKSCIFSATLRNHSIAFTCFEYGFLLTFCTDHTNKRQAKQWVRERDSEMIAFKSQLVTHLIELKCDYCNETMATAAAMFDKSNNFVWRRVALFSIKFFFLPFFNNFLASAANDCLENCKTCLYVCLLSLVLTFSLSLDFLLIVRLLSLCLSVSFSLTSIRLLTSTSCRKLYDAVQMSKCADRVRSPNESNHFISLSLFMFIYFYFNFVICVCLCFLILAFNRLISIQLRNSEPTKRTSQRIKEDQNSECGCNLRLKTSLCDCRADDSRKERYRYTSCWTGTHHAQHLATWDALFANSESTHLATLVYSWEIFAYFSHSAKRDCLLWDCNKRSFRIPNIIYLSLSRSLHKLKTFRVNVFIVVIQTAGTFCYLCKSLSMFPACKRNKMTRKEHNFLQIEER